MSNLIARVSNLKTLIIDSDEKFISQILKEASYTSIDPLISETLQDARLKLSDPKTPIKAVFISENLIHANSLKLIRYCHLYRTGIPIFWLSSANSPFQLSNEQLESLGIQKIIKKPIKTPELVKLISEIADQFKQHLPEPKIVSLTIDEKTTNAEDDFIAILARNFLMGSKCFFDLYIKVKPTHYLKIVNAKDQTPVNRVESYINKGIDRFYIHKKAHEDYLKYCDYLADKLLSEKSVPLSLVTSQILHAGEQTLKFIAASGVSQESIVYAEKFVQRNLQLTESYKLQNNFLIQSFLEDIHNHEHCAAVSIFSSLIAKELGLENERIQNILGFSALLHDIGLHKHAPQLLAEEVWKMSPDELDLFRKHPEEGAKLLSDLDRVEPASIQAIAQHHQRRNGKGFPEKMPGKPINQLAEIIGISDDFIQTLKLWKLKDHRFDVFKEAQKRIFDGFTFPVINAFQAIFKKSN